MRKEVIFALVAGAVFGLVIAFGAIRTNSAISPVNVVPDNVAENNSPNIFSQDFGLIITSPQENDVVTTSSQEITGLTGAGNWVSISTDNEDHIILADEEGNFSQSIKLVSGINNIGITSFSENNVNEVELTVIYSSEFSKVLGVITEDEEQL